MLWYHQGLREGWGGMEATLDRTFDVTATKQKPDRRLHISTLRITLIAMAILAFLFTFTFTTTWGERMDQLSALSSTDAFKTMDLETLDGTHFTSENLKDARITIFNVWGTTCPPCIREIPYLQRINNEYAPGEVQVVGLLMDSVDARGTVVQEHLDEARKLMADSDATYPTIILDQATYAFLSTNTVGTPTTFYVDSDGNIIRTVTGGNTYNNWKAYTDEELAKLSQ